MDNREKRKLAVERELEELARIADRFRDIAIQARHEADALALWSRRMDKIREEEALDLAIEELEEKHREAAARKIVAPDFRRDR